MRAGTDSAYPQYNTKSAEREWAMDKNKNRKRDRGKSNAELRKMEPKDNADIGIIDGEKTGVHGGGHEKSGRKG